MTLISFIIPTYNSASFVDKCLDSIYAQAIDVALYEVIVIDDGSSDNTVEVLEKYARQYPNFTYRVQQNAGPGVARNNGMKSARGEYLVFVDSDDYILPYDFESLITKVCLPQQLDILALSMCSQEGDRVITQQERDANGYSKNTADVVFTGCEYMIKNNFIASPCSYIFRRRFMTDNKIYYGEVRGCEDIDHTIIALFTARRIQYTTDQYYVCCGREGSLSRTPTITFELALTHTIRHAFAFLRQQEQYRNNPQLQQVLSDWLIYIFSIQYQHLFLLPINKIWHILKTSKSDIRFIYQQQQCSPRFSKQKRLLGLRACSSPMILGYILIQKCYFRLRHAK